MKSPKKLKTTLTVDLSTVLLARLREVAKQNGRTISAEIRFAIKRNNRSPVTADQEELVEMDAIHVWKKYQAPVDYPPLEEKTNRGGQEVGK